MIFVSSWYILPAAFALDFLLGDPERLFHPVRVMGRAIVRCEPIFRKMPGGPLLTGTLFAAFLICTTWVVTFLLLKTVFLISGPVGICLEVILAYYCISARSLEKAAMDVKRAMEDSGLKSARKKVSWIVGRQTDELTCAGVNRAVVETIAENFVDGVVSPVFYMAVGGVPLAMAYKMINTLDSMVGYKNEKYILFGRAAAKIDDVFNYIPARISPFIIAFSAYILSGRGSNALRTAATDGRKHSSPNAGYPEAAFAGVLNVKLGGPNYYHGMRVEKPYIGEQFHTAGGIHIIRACDLMMLSSLLWVVFLTFLTVFK